MLLVKINVTMLTLMAVFFLYLGATGQSLESHLLTGFGASMLILLSSTGGMLALRKKETPR
ncbi:hypothetical protein LCGC14_0163450 [marine sediment metagenome]|uniref:Uncharacterized protein n=1 Tax=marine sediment metagenome TaxID=412755 RepID=A0A0F9XCH8_9ZZZZ